MNFQLDRPFKMIVFDWDGTAVPSRTADAIEVRRRLERLLELGILIVVITGTSFANIDRQLSAAIRGAHKQRLYLCTNRGSEVYGFDSQSNSTLRHRRVATPDEDRLLTAVADRVRDILQSRTGLELRVVYDRLNRRKIDLIPLPEWRDPPKAAIGQLLDAVEGRLRGAGLAGGLHEAFEIARTEAVSAGLSHARITSDVKHIEVGLTDKGDSVHWAMSGLARQAGITSPDVLIAGDEFGPIGGFEGSDSRMMIPEAAVATFVSVGVEPEGVPAGVIHLGGGPSRFRELLDRQILSHRGFTAVDGEGKGELFAVSAPAAVDDPGWVLVEEGFSPAREHEIESLFTVANGYIGTRGAVDEVNPISRPATFIAGLFDAVPGSSQLPELVVAPNWTRLDVEVQSQKLGLDRGKIMEQRRILDLRRGIFRREWRHRDPQGRITRLSFIRFASLADRRVVVQLVSLVPQNYTGYVRVEALVDGQVTNSGGARHLAVCTPAEWLLVARTSTSGMALALASWGSGVREQGSGDGGQETEDRDQRTGDAARKPGAGGTDPRPPSPDEGTIGESWAWEAHLGERYDLARAVVVATSRQVLQPAEVAQAGRDRLSRESVRALRSAHEQAWAERWQTCDVEIQGNAEAQRALRFALFHLVSAANPDDERVSIGARGLTGEAYKGHVFWDVEIYMLPFYVFTHPPSARALLMYRYHTLPAARARATTMGYRGALYAWESAATGEDVTPRFVLTPIGEVVPILSGEMEHHISADVAYGVWLYWQATGDDSFLLAAGAEMIFETARFWASRTSLEEDGRYHIKRVIGPDEYHEGVDDSAYTNMMAQWVLQRAKETADIFRRRWPARWESLAGGLGLMAEEVESWREIGDRLFTGFDPATGLFEQFADYFNLEYVDLEAYEPRTAPMDVVLGRQRTGETQVIKQADVVLLLHLLRQQMSHQVRVANFRYYEPRTGHGSSLSPGIYAAVAAQLGDLELAWRYFKQAGEIDLADNMGNAADGLHIGAMGSLWQAAVLGFGGMRLREDGLSFDPHVPPEWGEMRFPVQWQGRRLRVTLSATPPAVEVGLEAGAPMAVAVGEEAGQTIELGRRYRTEMEGGSWTAWKEVGHAKAENGK
ncbi:MAG: glycoside hydrolase family 65 protein [Chloroflexi bacterium]|nr:glycoside hydrolase family 65 protein [Chloroflexota bacterium]